MTDILNKNLFEEKSAKALADCLLAKINDLTEKINAILPVVEFYNALPVDDDVTYGLKNRKAEIIADPDEEVQVDYAPTAASISLAALETGHLELPADATEKMIEEIREILGDEIFNDLSVQSAATLEMKVEPSFEEKLAKAKESYFERKEFLAQLGAQQEATLDVEKPKSI